jgi:hypothetical protein
MNDLGLEAFFEETKLHEARQKVASWREGFLLRGRRRGGNRFAGGGCSRLH